MVRRIVNVALLSATIVGAVMAFGSARELHGLQAEYERLRRTAGELTVTDPMQLHLQAIPTKEPLHFAWRVYLPAGQIRIAESTGKQGSSGISTSWNAQPREVIARVRFTVNPSGQTGIYSNFGNSSGYWTLGSAEIFRALESHQKELEIEQLGSPALVRVKPGEAATLLRVRVPDFLVEEIHKSTADSRFDQLLPNVYESRLDLQP